MICRTGSIVSGLLLLVTATSMAQTVDAPTGQKTLAATIGVYVFPAEGQAASKQSQEEAQCYSWAVDNTKNDPFELAKRAEQERAGADRRKAAVAEAGQGAGARGAIGGAAAGALIGEIASNDAGEGAAWGAAAGLIGARRKARRGRAQAEQQIERDSSRRQQATAEQIDGFKKAFSVCLEAKDYLVKF